MLLFGRMALSDVELLALVLGGGMALHRAFGLLHGFGGLLGLDRASAREIAGYRGIGVASATAVAGALELGRRAAQLCLPHAPAMQSADDVVAFAKASLGAEEQESFLLLGLDARQRVRMVRRVALGSLAQVDVHPREVFRPLIRESMHAAIVVHNHPSGEPAPSHADLELTARLAEVGRLLGIPILDHLIVTRDRHVSVAALGLLPGRT